MVCRRTLWFELPCRCSFAMWALKQFRRVSVEEDYHELQERVKTMEDMFKDRPCLLHRPDVRLKIVTSDDKPIDRPQGL